MTRKQKLTLSIDKEVVRRAKQLAREWDTSVSGLVEESLRGLAETGRSADPPLVAELRGSLPEDVDREAYRQHLEEKHDL